MSKNILKTDVRRGLLKTLAVGGVSGAVVKNPESWSKPLVNSVMLPGHAETSTGEIKLVVPGATINVCDDVYEGSQAELYTFYTLGHTDSGELEIVESVETFTTLFPAPSNVGPNQVLVYQKRRRLEPETLRAQIGVFTALEASTVATSEQCEEESLERFVEVTYEKDEVALEVDGKSYTVEVTILGKDDPLRLTLFDLIVR